MMSDERNSVLVTGAFGLVGSATVKRLVADGWHVVATDLQTPAYEKAARSLPPGVQVRWADLTDWTALDCLVTAVSPKAIVHLVGMIPPGIYRNAALARKVNIDITRQLVDAAQAQPTPPRFVHASSVAVYGPRNPHRHTERVQADSPTMPNDIYGAQKLEAERCVRASNLDWVILRLGAVFTTDLAAFAAGLDSLFFESALPSDGRVHSVDVRDVATAFATATTAAATGRILLIGGDDSHLLRYGDAARALTEAAGVGRILPIGRPGDPENDDAWFHTDWMDTGPAQELLSFQHYSWPDILTEIGGRIGWKRYPLRLLAPLVRVALERRSAYYKAPGKYADPWGAIRNRLGEPIPQ
jgi:nucleoside-diphosphate-sugar epimerase